MVYLRIDIYVMRLIVQINDYIENEKDTSGSPKLIIGEAGAGKSSIMAKAASNVLQAMEEADAQPW